MDIDTEELKVYAPIIPYVKKHYADRIHIEREHGNVAFAKCIWHEENTASLTFFSNGTYKCFGCGEHGDLISLVRKLENVSFQEACKMIGDNVGYEVQLEEPNPAHEHYKDMMDNNTRRYWNNLQNNGEALKYLICERGLTKDSIDLFRLGFTDSEEYKYRSDMGGISNKITFPILEHKKRSPKCVGVAYRGLTDEKPKYINDVNQDGREGQNQALAGVFVKGDLLYGLSFAYDAIRDTGYVILVEGYFDVISLHQSGIINVAGVMGTSITDSQITTISKLTKNVLLFLDGDKAGETAMIKIIANLYKAGLNVAMCKLDNNMDPADLCKYFDFDGNKINGLIRQHTKQAVEFVINKAVEKYETISLTEKTRALRTAMPILDSVQDESIRDLYKSMLYKRLDIK